MGKVNYQGEKLNIQFTRYSENNNIAIRLYNEKGPWCVATINLGVKLPDSLVAIKNYSENEGVLEALREAKIVGETVDVIPSGFVIIPIVKLLVKPNI